MVRCGSKQAKSNSAWSENQPQPAGRHIECSEHNCKVLHAFLISCVCACVCVCVCVIFVFLGVLSPQFAGICHYYGARCMSVLC